MAPDSARRRAFSVSTLARHGGRVLLIHHQRLRAWLPVGGEIDAGETPLEAAARELREETGLVGSYTGRGGVEGTPPGLIGYEEHEAGSKGLHMNFAFVADVPTEAVKPNDEFGEYRWVSSAEGLDAPRNVKELVAIALVGATKASPEALRALAERWLAAFNGRDLDALLALYDDAAVHTSPNLRARDPQSQGKIVGKAKLREWWRDCFERLPGLRYDATRLTADGECVWMEYRRSNPGEADRDVAEVLRVREGRIVESRVHSG